jgi:hypothetical protein
LKKFKERWNIQSDFQLAIIILVFSLNGSLAVYVAKPLLNFVGLNQETINPLIFWPLRILIVFLVYQFTLIIIGTLFGQKEFFLNFSKKMWSRFNFIKS